MRIGRNRWIRYDTAAIVLVFVLDLGGYVAERGDTDFIMFVCFVFPFVLNRQFTNLIGPKLVLFMGLCYGRRYMGCF